MTDLSHMPSAELRRILRDPMTDSDPVSTATADELRAIVTNTADADLRARARAELRRRPAESQRRQADPRTAREVVPHGPVPAPLSSSEIRAARRFEVVLLDGRRPFAESP